MRRRGSRTATFERLDRSYEFPDRDGPPFSRATRSRRPCRRSGPERTPEAVREDRQRLRRHLENDAGRQEAAPPANGRGLMREVHQGVTSVNGVQFMEPSGRASGGVHVHTFRQNLPGGRSTGFYGSIIGSDRSRATASGTGHRSRSLKALWRPERAGGLTRAGRRAGANAWKEVSRP
jgi:hypothetical protein